ncbi:MAG: recombinase family protein [Planctomycetia bacterium]|nr:recombinase family protein [Planctomycetia bacterium]
MVRAWGRRTATAESSPLRSPRHGLDQKQVRWFVDQESGKTLKRPKFEELQKAIFSGEIKTVIVWKLDRLSRRLKDGVCVLAEAGGEFKYSAEVTSTVIEMSETEAGRTYYAMKRDSLLKRAATGEASQARYTVAADVSIADVATMAARMEPHAVRAETAGRKRNVSRRKRRRIGSN